MILNGKTIHCYGCGVCATACPHKAIQIVESNEGFWVPEVNPVLCVDCGICDRICSYTYEEYLVPNDRLDNTYAYAVVNKDKDILEKSTSGGAGFAIATCLRNQGYTLVGVKYDTEKNIACHFTTNSLEEFKQTMNSKYIPSYTVDGFSGLMDGKRYAVFGTPCQIDSLRRWARLRKKEDNFVFIDLFCHGVPSYLHWRSYLKYHLRENEKLLEPVFRDKRNGWHAYTMSLKTDRRTISTRLQKNDFFQNIFFGNFSLNKTCYTCKFRGNRSAADLRMGDLWGAKYAKNESGITGVLALTSKGMEIMKAISELGLCEVVQEEESVMQAGQLHHDLPVPKTREALLKGFREATSLPLLYLKYVRRMWLKNLVPYRIKCLIKQIIYTVKKK